MAAYLHHVRALLYSKSHALFIFSQKSKGVCEKSISFSIFLKPGWRKRFRWDNEKHNSVEISLGACKATYYRRDKFTDYTWVESCTKNESNMTDWQTSMSYTLLAE